MNRLSFLKRLGLLSAGATLAPLIKLVPEAPIIETIKEVPITGFIGTDFVSGDIIVSESGIQYYVTKAINNITEIREIGSDSKNRNIKDLATEKYYKIYSTFEEKS